MAGWTGLEPAASGVTGRRYNQLNYHPCLKFKLNRPFPAFCRKTQTEKSVTLQARKVNLQKTRPIRCGGGFPLSAEIIRRAVFDMAVRQREALYSPPSPGDLKRKGCNPWKRRGHDPAARIFFRNGRCLSKRAEFQATSHKQDGELPARFQKT